MTSANNSRRVPNGTSSSYRSGYAKIEKEQSERKLAIRLKYEHGSKGVEASSKMRELAPASPVLVYRSSTRGWEGPFKFVNIEEGTAVVQLKHGRKTFRSICVKSYVKLVGSANNEHSMYSTTNVLSKNQLTNCRNGGIQAYTFCTH